MTQTDVFASEPSEARRGAQGSEHLCSVAVAGCLVRNTLNHER